MTSKLTREENVQAVFDLKAGYTLGLADVEILKRVARMALAAMDSEPVAEVCEDYAIRYISSGPAPKEGLHPGDKLYRHAQQPVVPDERAVELLATDLMKRIDKITGERHSVVTLSSLRVSIVEACRAAMLNGGKS
ncbi:hypothetical protein LZV53_22050 [Klebsiella michiganensis]|uniref:hypothetical protein n=1 Tax=Klebsiella michiganensis TaxID=1134687 RepID=UPI001F238F64|nr:hypothetical protein [Klebsiella michiganensis]MCE7547229.1 hypothetical protein [Klebsiella michiganensis]